MKESTALIVSKVGAMLLLFGIGLVGAGLPICLRRLKLNRTIALCGAFAGGAFLALGMFHILPDAVEDLKQAGMLIRIGTQTYNSAYLFLFAGFILILFCESIIFVPEHKQPHHVEVLTCPHDFDLEKAPKVQPTGDLSMNCRASELESMSMSRSQQTTEAITEDAGKSMRSKEVEHWRYVFHSGGIFLMMALAAHGLFEGIVIGTSMDLVGVWMTTLVIFGHKWAESFSLMTQFIDSEMGVRSMWILMTTFLLSSPIGIAIGIAAAEGKVASGVCNALGAGTIFYVAAEITGSVFSTDPGQRFSKFFVYLLGSAAVLGLTLVEMTV
eukprot:GHVS01015423.1.p1 GENE.GHVS01015423.1~~GHVS01015423.1.p1  ORF type:complete len:327 (-),score=23.57 GHVS01015423.1:246-1226(-)